MVRDLNCGLGPGFRLLVLLCVCCAPGLSAQEAVRKQLWADLSLFPITKLEMDRFILV